jgi:hypothetical protein
MRKNLRVMMKCIEHEVICETQNYDDFVGKMVEKLHIADFTIRNLEITLQRLSYKVRS